MTNTNLRCETCRGTGEAATDYGMVDCPDCGGSGALPSRNVRVRWLAADIERALAHGKPIEPEHVRWLLDELLVARAALTEIISLAHDSQDENNISRKIRFSANRALGLYDIKPEPLARES